jgi:hypothetical protein
VTYGTRCFSAVLRRLRRSALLWLVALFIFTSVSPLTHPELAHAQDAQSSNPSSSNLGGTVINGVTREPIARALVYSEDKRFATFTDD